MSIRQGDHVGALISNSKLPWNRAFAGRAVAVPAHGPLPRVVLAGGVVVTLLSPMMEQLGQLRQTWERGYKKGGLRPDTKGATVEPAVEEEAFSAPDEIRRTAAQQEFDMAPEDINLESLADAPFREDKSVANGSSIALLVEVGDRSLLIGGDAYSRVLEESTRRLLHERGQKRLHLSVFVVPHGGSHNSASRELLELLTCDRYVISTDGQLFRHPDRETMARIIVYGRAKPDSALTLIFNYRSQVNGVWASPILQRRYKYKTVYPDGDQSSIHVIV